MRLVTILFLTVICLQTQSGLAFSGNKSTPWIFNLSAPFCSECGWIKIQVHKDDTVQLLYVSTEIELQGLAALLSGHRRQEFLTIMSAGATTDIAGLVHYQRVDVDSHESRINYGWSWNRNPGSTHVAARRFWGGTLVERTGFDPGADVVLDLLSLFVRISMHAAGAHTNVFPLEYELFDPAGNIRVTASLVPAAVDMSEMRCIRAYIEFARRPFGFASKSITLLISPGGTLMGGRLKAAGGLLPVTFSLQE